MALAVDSQGQRKGEIIKRKNPNKNIIISKKPSVILVEVRSNRAWFISHPMLARIAPRTKHMPARTYLILSGMKLKRSTNEGAISINEPNPRHPL